ncbi:ubiquitin-related domain-containing protein [Aspergillus avenaceus]|uniref:Ubiquitin-related domain-containing protein n=1 Tax=Aspergillus avenaceus TaxID=36643 RepID=A0A5N6U786_ASPAV|nr:ubiquitin-related domain-containing protein [Aspergillus avenaceus]
MSSGDDHLQSHGPGSTENAHSVATTFAPSQESNVQSVTTPASLPELAENSNASGPQIDAVAKSSETQPVATGETTTPNSPANNTNASAESGDPKVEAPAAELSSQASEAKDEDSGPSLVITLLLISGSRHPFKIDGNYLKKRSVNVENNDPFGMSVYTLKELIWREWRQDWEPRPSSPSYIRLISFGKLLDDNAPLSDSKFNRDAPNVVHMTVKPQELIDEEDAKGAKAQYTREREASERSPGCRCIIQ